MQGQSEIFNYPAARITRFKLEVDLSDADCLALLSRATVTDGHALLETIEVLKQQRHAPQTAVEILVLLEAYAKIFAFINKYQD